MIVEKVENETTLVTVESSAEADSCVIWLHGLGADGYDFQPVIPYLKLPSEMNVRFLFPHAEVMPVTINGGMPMRAWYDILEMDIDRKVDKTSLLRSSERIQRLIQQQIDQGIDSDKIILIGFSQGGAVAYHSALTFSQPLAGLLALSTYMATADELTTAPRSVNASLPVWVAHGAQDDVVPVSLGEQAVLSLEQMGYQPDWKIYPMGHEVCLEQLEAIGQRVTALLLNRD